jgi:hypothetical protein
VTPAAAVPAAIRVFLARMGAWDLVPFLPCVGRRTGAGDWAMQSGRTRCRVVLGTIVAVLAWSCAAPAQADDHPVITDELTPVRSITVHFDRGKFAVSKDQKGQLQELAKDAKSLNGYMIQVAAYASATGSEAESQRLSMERANAVTAILRQSGVPLANVIVPAAMRISEDRRAVVTLLQNKNTGQ